MENYTPVFRYPLTENDGWKKLSGELTVKMTNDYLFRALLQSDNEVLKALLASVLHMDKRDICSARVTNPILLGEHIDDRTYILDVSVVLNDRAHIDLEMQVVKETWWADRSLLYICRSYDRMNRGSAYINVKPVRQIAFCDFTLFRASPEFCADYMLINRKKPDVIYSDTFIISNIDLTRIDLATEEDRKYGIDNWALFFKAKTWEDMKMLAERDANLERAISGMWQLTEEEMIREQCRAREEWIINDNWKNETIEQQKQALEKFEINDKRKTETIEQLERENALLKERLGLMQDS